MTGGIFMNMSGSFLLWKGAQMDREKINQYEQCASNLQNSIYLPYHSSFTFDLRAALSRAFEPSFDTASSNPVLFTLACQNYLLPKGAMFLNAAYTPYLEELEYLFT